MQDKEVRREVQTGLLGQTTGLVHMYMPFSARMEVHVGVSTLLASWK